jgi:hypothetical protein
MVHKKTTLLILTPYFPLDEGDSTCLPAQQSMVRALKKNFPFIQFIILSFEYPFTKTSYRWSGNQVIPFDNRNRAKWSRLLTWASVWRTMENLCKQNDVLGIFSFRHGECALIGKYFARRRRLKHYNWILGQDAGEDNRYAAFIKSRPEELLAISESVSDSFYIHHSVKPRYILPAGIDPSLFPFRGICRDIDLLGTGILASRNQYTVWTRVAGILSRQYPDVRIKLCGKMPHQELLGHMQRARIFLHTSIYEGFSTTCLEALYTGAHVISFYSPLHHPLDHWHIVRTQEEMAETALALLEDPYTDYSPVFPYSMDDNASTVMRLFAQP